MVVVVEVVIVTAYDPRLTITFYLSPTTYYLLPTTYDCYYFCYHYYCYYYYCYYYGFPHMRASKPYVVTPWEPI